MNENTKRILIIILVIILVGSIIGFALAGNSSDLNVMNKQPNLTNVPGAWVNSTNPESNSSVNSTQPMTFQEKLIQANYGMQRELKDCKDKLILNWVAYISLAIAIICIIDRLYFRFRKAR